MTREEAILKWIVPAIKNTWNEKKCNEILKALEQEPCEDAISRQAVLDMVEDMTDQFGNKHSVVTEGMISLLPPVIPQPKTDVLDKIRAEIVDLGQRTMNDNRASGIWACRDIIDKYKAESEK